KSGEIRPGAAAHGHEQRNAEYRVLIARFKRPEPLEEFQKFAAASFDAWVLFRIISQLHAPPGDPGGHRQDNAIAGQFYHFVDHETASLRTGPPVLFSE